MRRFLPLTTLLLSGCFYPFAHPETDARWLDPKTGLASSDLPTTLPKGRPLRVAVFGDTQGNRQAARAVAHAIRAAHPDLVIFAGDALNCLPAGHVPDLGPLTYAVPWWPQYQRDKPAFGLLSLVPFPALLHETLLRPAGGAPRDPDGWNLFLEETAALRLEDRTPLVFAPGNHDTYHDFDRAEIARLWNAAHPRALWRSFDVGPFRFVVLDTGNDLRGDFDPLDPDGLQLEWLAQQLKGAKASGLHAVVVTHFPPYTSGAQDPPAPQVRDRVARAILANHDVALVLSGHVHAYERLEVADAKGRLVTHVVTGGAGGPFHGIEEKRREAGSKAFVGHLRHFVLLEMSETEIRGRMVPVASPEAYVENWQEKGGDEFVVKLK